MGIFKYTDEQIQWLKSRDSVLGAAIDKIGRIERQVMPDLYTALINSIVGQQISTKAHETVWARIVERFSPITPENLKNVTAQDLQSCGMTMRKAVYIKEITDNVTDGSLDLVQLQTLTDDEVCARLVKIKGVGVWTAEMLMTFSMQRPDILSCGV